MALTIPVEEISAQARQVDVRKAVLAVARLLWTAVLWVPYTLGWTLRKISLAVTWALHKVWLAVTMLGAAAVVGWRDATRSPAKDDAET